MTQGASLYWVIETLIQIEANSRKTLTKLDMFCSYKRIALKTIWVFLKRHKLLLLIKVAKKKYDRHFFSQLTPMGSSPFAWQVFTFPAGPVLRIFPRQDCTVAKFGNKEQTLLKYWKLNQFMGLYLHWGDYSRQSFLALEILRHFGCIVLWKETK